MNKDLKIIHAYFEKIKSDKIVKKYSVEIQSILDNIESIDEGISSKGLLSTSITMPREKAQACSLCQKSVIYKNEKI
jgi:hypothetical protein